MVDSKNVFKKLNELNIYYEIVSHPPALEMELADKYIEGKEGVRTKTLFICDKKKRNYYLVAMDEGKRLDMKVLEEKIGQKNLKLVSKERMKEKIGLTKGMVSVFGIINNHEKDIIVILDKEMEKEIVTFYANDCTKTIFIKFSDVVRAIKALKNQVLIIKL